MNVKDPFDVEIAFPFQYDLGDGTSSLYRGMTLRDYFAAKALVGILAGGFAYTIPHDDAEGGRQAAELAYQYSDALLMARQSPQDSVK